MSDVSSLSFIITRTSSRVVAPRASALLLPGCTLIITCRRRRIYAQRRPSRTVVVHHMYQQQQLIVDHEQQGINRASASSTRVSSFVSIRSSAERALLLAESASDASCRVAKIILRTEYVFLILTTELLADGHTSSTIKIRESSIQH